MLAAERLHGDDTTVPVLAKTKTDVARLWTYVRDDRPFTGPAPPVALFRYSRDSLAGRPLAHLTGYGGILQADAYAGYNALFRAGRSPAPLTRALCWAHSRRKFFELADAATQLKRRKKAPVISPVAVEAVRRIDRVFDVERAITGTTAAHRLAVRQEIAAPLVAELEQWLRSQRATLARHNPVAGAIDYMLNDWSAFTQFLADGRICLTNNAARRALRGIALVRKAWLFVGSDRGGERAAFMYSPIVTAKPNDIGPQAWLADVLARIAEPTTPACRVVAVELACRTRRAGRRGRPMASPSYAFTARYVAERIGADQDLIEEIAAMQMDPEDGVLSIIDSSDETAESVVVFTNFGIDRLKELLDEHTGTNPPPT